MPVDYNATPGLGGVNAFWFEYNSSAKRTGPEIDAWFRNFIVMQDIADADAMVTMGANVGAGVTDPPPLVPRSSPPSSVTDLSVQ